MHVKNPAFQTWLDSNSTTESKFHFFPHCSHSCLHFSHLLFFLVFSSLMEPTRDWTHLDQRHLWAESQQNFLCLCGVGVVSVLVEPLLERSRHVLQGLALVSHFTAAGTTPVEQHGEKRQTVDRTNALLQDVIETHTLNLDSSHVSELWGTFIA